MDNVTKQKNRYSSLEAESFIGDANGSTNNYIFNLYIFYENFFPISNGTSRRKSGRILWWFNGEISTDIFFCLLFIVPKKH